MKKVFPTQGLIQWYNQEKRDLPWRLTRDPYMIWLSEIILQQTRVDQGLSYYRHFERKYPTVQILAEADEQEVLRSWQGLGYYSRARNLHAAAKSIIADGGQFPSTYESILSLKGVGPYTAAAVASFAFKEIIPVVDGNVNRVISRYLALEEAVDTAAGSKAIRFVLEEAISRQEPDTFNQAIMELGALVCKPKSPDCSSCPLRESCEGFRLGNMLRFPIKKGKTKVQDRWLYMFLITDDDHVLLNKRDDSGIWKNMFELPTLETRESIGEEHLIPAIQSKWADLTLDSIAHFKETTHILSHRKFHVNAYKVLGNPDLSSLPSGFHLVPWAELDDYPLPRLTDKLLENWQSAKG